MGKIADCQDFLCDDGLERLLDRRHVDDGGLLKTRWTKPLRGSIAALNT